MNARRHLVALVGLGAILVASGCPGARKAALGCKGTKDCVEDGRCSVGTYRTGDAVARCYATSARDCAASTRCAEDGVCDYEPRAAESSDFATCRALTFASCLRSRRCREEGACTPDGDRCIVTDWGCRRSEACARDRRCAARAMRCVASDVSDERRCDEACRGEGACTWDGRMCVATHDEDCERSRVCAESGRCTADSASGACVARSTDVCRASSACRSRRRCAVEPGMDVCMRVEPPCDLECWASGRCVVREHACAAASDAECAASVDCAVRGACRADARSGFCFPATAEDCQRSLECKAFGRCERARRRECIRPGEASAMRQACTHSCDREGKCLSSPDLRCVSAEEAGLAPWRPRPRSLPEPLPPRDLRPPPGNASDPDARAACDVVRRCVPMAKARSARGVLVVTTNERGQGTRARYTLEPYKEHAVPDEVVVCFEQNVQLARTSRAGDSRCSFSFEVGKDGALSGGTLSSFSPVLTR